VARSSVTSILSVLGREILHSAICHHSHRDEGGGIEQRFIAAHRLCAGALVHEVSGVGQ